MSTIYFQPDNRSVVIAESCSDLKEAEKQVDRFLDSISDQDEAGSHYQRISVSGTEQDGKYYFDVVVIF